MRREYGYFEEDKLGKPYDMGLLKRLFPFVLPFKWMLVASILLVSLVTVLDLALPYLTKIAIDRYVVQSISRSGGAGDLRMYQTDLAVSVNRDIVGRYKDLFKVEGHGATIRYEDLAKLDRSDLAALRKDDRAGVAWIALTFLGVAVCHFVLSFFNVLVLEYAGQSIMHDFRGRLYEHIQGLSIRFFSKHPVGRLVTRLTSDVQNMHEFFTSIITVLFKDIFLLIGIAVVLAAMNWKLALVCFVLLPLVFFSTIYFSRLARDVYRVGRIKIAQLNSKIQETIEGIRIIQLFRKEDENFDRFKRLNHENYEIGMREIDIFAVFMPVIEVFSAVTTGLVVWYGGHRVMDGTLTLGVLVAFVSYMKMFFRPIRDMAEKYNIMQSAMASCERIFLLFDTHDRIPAPERSEGAVQASGAAGSPALFHAPATAQAVSFNGVWFAYEQDHWVIKDFCLEVMQGETVAIVGATGAGKSTIVHLLERFYDPQRGVVRMGGVDLRKLSEDAVRGQIALISQDVFLFADTILNNIIAGGALLSPDRLKVIVDGCNLQRIIARLPQGLDTVLTEAGRTLSSGERQLIAFARALAKDARILILDEATSSIDTETEQLIQDVTLRIMKGRTSIVVAHRLSTIRHADRIVVMHKGRIKEIGTHDALMAKKGLYYRLYQWQSLSQDMEVYEKRKT